MMGDVLIPILKDNKDPHYRYKMPKLTAKVEGSGNGIKTVITNMSAVAKALDRPASYPTKYFGCELGAQVTMSNDQYVVNGSHDTEKLINYLYGFIRKFVLCTKCNNPETSLTISNQNIRQKCIACGHETIIPKTIHKLTTYIINHPPEGNGVASSTKSTKSTKSDKKSKKSSNGSSSPTGKTESADAGEKRTAIIDYNNDDDGFDDEEFTVDALTERLREGLKNGMKLNDPKESANLFYQIVKQKKEANELQDVNVHKELLKEAERLDIKDKSTLILSELLFTENIIEEVKIYRMLLLRFCHENRKAQKYLLGGFEKLVGDVYKDKLLNNALKVLKQFYDEDIIDEETIIEWAAKESKKYVSKEMSKKIHEKVAPLVKWLKEAEVEEDSGEDEDEEVKIKAEKQNGSNIVTKKSNDEDEEDDMIDFSHRVSGIHIESVKPAAVPRPVNADVVADASKNDAHDGDEDLDIDNI